MRLLVSLLLYGIFILISCTPEPQDPPSNPPVTPPGSGRHGLYVFVTGDSIAQASLKSYPIYWENGKQVHLLPETGVGTLGLALSDTAVYVSAAWNTGINKTLYWKNGVPKFCTDSDVHGFNVCDLVLDGNDVYTLGFATLSDLNDVPIYWKNNEPSVRINNGFDWSYDARRIAIAKGNVYITGSGRSPLPGVYYSLACYWKNGTTNFLKPLSSDQYKNSLAKAIKVVGDDVHITGEVYLPGGGLQRGTAYYWKNGEPLALTGHDSLSYAEDMVVVGQDVYIAGAVSASVNSNFRACYWKNGQLQVLAPLASVNSYANGIDVFEGDVYVAGNRSLYDAMIWKNGTANYLGNGTARAVRVKRYN